MIPAEARGSHLELVARLRPFVARRVSESDVEDVLQNIFLRVQRALPDLRDDERFGTWVYRVARTAVADHWRERARNPLAEADAPDASTSRDEDDDRAAEERVVLAIVPFVSRLPDPYRQAITLTELEGLTQRQAAEMLGVSLPALKSRVLRGRALLRDLLNECCEIALDVRGRVIACEPRSSELAYETCCPPKPPS